MKTVHEGQEAELQHFPNYITKAIREVPLGTCFAFRIRDQMCIGMAVVPAREGDAPALVALWPGHPGLDGRPGILDGSVVRSQPLLTMPDARVVLPTDPRQIHVDRGGWRRAGAIMTAGSDIGAAAVAGSREILVFNMRDGSVMDEGSYGAAWFSSWKIALPGANGEWNEVCQVRAEMSEPE